MTFNEDQSRLRVGHGAKNMAVIRHFALNLVRHLPDKRSIKRRRKCAAWDQNTSCTYWGRGDVNLDSLPWVGGYFGLVGMPYDSGDSQRDQGISKAGNHRARELAIELAWLWVRHQPDSDVTIWFHKRVGDIKGRIRRIAIVAVARKLMVALWRYLETGVVPTGAVLRPSL